MPLGIRWYQHVWNDEVRRSTKQPYLSAIDYTCRLSQFSHVARMLDIADTKNFLTASPLGNWRRPLDVLL